MPPSVAVRLRTALAGPRSLITFIRAELFGSLVQTVLSIGAVLGAAGLYFSVTELFVRFSEQLFEGEQDRLLLYLSFTYSMSALGFIGWFSVYRRVQLVLDRERHQRELIAQIHHEIAEIVRTAAINRSGGGLAELQKVGRVLTLLQGELPRYLESKFGRKDISIAVKYAVRGEDGALKLKALFRRCCQNEHSRNNEMELNDSVVFAKFKNADRSVQRIIICDTKELSTLAAIGEDEKRRNENYRNYAKDCGFRSVLAFPLRAPKKDDHLEINQFRGFISFDCPEPNAFEPLFDVPMFSSWDNDGSHCRDTDDLNFFFGLADNLATLALLFDDADAIVGVHEREAEATSHATA